jgi:hypothetical protein
MSPPAKPITVMVSSTVYGLEDLLDRVYDLLTEFGYEVWMSHKGTLPVFSTVSAFENCLQGVRRCQIYLGIIGTRYGTGVDPDDRALPSIVHQELRLAIELKKPRWLLAHENIMTARTLLTKLGHAGPAGRKTLKLQRSDVLEDLRLIDMYEEAIFDRLPLPERIGNWVQKFHDEKDSGRYIISQFRRYQEVEAYLREHFKAGSPFPEAGNKA